MKTAQKAVPNTRRRESSRATGPPESGGVLPVRVRMYRQGLGDCFLLTFGNTADPRHILIDCGTLGTTTNGNSLAAVVENIKMVTGGHLHALVATHEHKDHLSGFASCKQTFMDDFTIDRCWVAWTENPSDQLARELEVYDNDLAVAAVKGVRLMHQYAASPALGDIELTRLADKAAKVLGFFGDDVLAADYDVFAAGKFAPTIHAAMELVRTGFGKREAEYLEPGSLVEVDDWLSGFRVYVLGPPKSNEAIGDTGESGGADLYPYPVAGIAAAADALLTSSRLEYLAKLSHDEFRREVPFDQRFQRSPSAIGPLYPAYADGQSDWRRIDSDWLGFSSVLALQLDNRTNNSSLVLAFERIADGKVLLFPADAQRGNWQSWSTPRELTWSVPDGTGGKKNVTTADLLKRTVFYKVGHHSSHNATAREHGLEKMEHNALVAFIPLDRKVAQAKKWNTMPTRALYKRLMEKCNGRVVRSDLGWVGQQEKEFVSMFEPNEWAAFRNMQKSAEQSGIVQIDNLFIDFTLR